MCVYLCTYVYVFTFLPTKSICILKHMRSTET